MHTRARKRAEHFYDFGPFRVDVMQRVLLRDGEPVALTAKTFDTLLVLLRNSGRIVDKDELMKTIWPDTVVEENNLNQNISAARKALGEGLDGKSYIETVPRRGYRFVGVVKSSEFPGPNVQKLSGLELNREAGGLENGSEVAVLATSPPSALSQYASRPRLAASPVQRRWMVAAGSGALLLGLALIVAISVRHPSAPHAFQPPGGVPALNQGKYLAVLPFRVVGDQAALDYVAEGLAGALSARLLDLRGLHVASAMDVDRAEKKGSLQNTARQLGANLLVQGTLQGTPEKMQIVVNLEDIAEGRRLWTGEFSGASRDVLALGDEIYSKLTATLELEPTNVEVVRGSARPTENIEAYDLYLRGANAMRHRQDLKNVEAAVRFQEEALKKDPGFALAYAGLADASLEMYQRKKDSFWSEKALLAAQRARRLDADLAEVHFVLGSVYEAVGNAGEAMAEEKRGLELASDSDEGYRRLASAYLAMGRRDDALKAYQKAVQINPYYWLNFNVLGIAYLQMGDSGAALNAFRRVTELEPDNAFGYDNVGAAYIRQGKWSESIPVYQRALQLQPHFVAYSNLGMAYFCLKRYDDATKMFEKAAAMNPNEQVVLGNLADAYRWSGQARKAMETYDRAIALAYKDLQVNPHEAGAIESLALYYAKEGKRSQAIEFIRQARSIDPDNVQFIYGEAQVMALAGRTGQALDALREAFRKGYPPEEAVSDPELNALRSIPQFAELIKRAQGKKT